jgi:hypothetical protein
MPSHVKIFFGIVAAIIAYGIVSAVWHLPYFHGRPVPRIALTILIISQVFLALVYLIPAWLAAFLRQGWARWVFVVVAISMHTLPVLEFGYLYLHGVTENARHAGELLLRGYLTSPRTITEAALLILATVFVFTGNARDWFNKRGVSVYISAASEGEL